MVREMEQDIAFADTIQVRLTMKDLFMPDRTYGFIIEMVGPNERKSHKIFEIMNPASTDNNIFFFDLAF